MKDERQGMDRRSFLKAGVQVAAGAAAMSAATGALAAPANKTIKATGTIPTRTLGKTGHVLPVLGHGGSAMVNTWEAAYMVKLDPEPERVKMVRHAYDVGIRYFDTARVYGESERIMGEALKDVRDNVYIASKVADPRPAKTRESVEKSLSELGTDYVDCMQIHSPAIERVGPDAAMKIYDELAKLRDEGMVRFIGLTTHVAFEDVYKMIDTGQFDQVLLAKGYMRRGISSILTHSKVEWREKCVARAHELGMGIVAMKTLGANMMGQGTKHVVPDEDPAIQKKLPGAALRWVLSDDRISVLNVGVSNPSDIDDNIKTMTSDLTLTDDDRMLLAGYAAKVYNSDYAKALPLT